MPDFSRRPCPIKDVDNPVVLGYVYCSQQKMEPFTKVILDFF